MSEFPKAKKKATCVFSFLHGILGPVTRCFWGAGAPSAAWQPTRRSADGVLFAAGQNTSRPATAGSTAAHRCRPCRQTPCQQASNTAASATGAGVCAHRRHRKGPRPAIPQKTAGCAAGAGERAPLPPPCPTLPRHPASKTALCRAAHTGGTDRTPFFSFSCSALQKQPQGDTISPAAGQRHYLCALAQRMPLPYFCRAARSSQPSTPQESTSPAPTVSMKNGMVPSA